jgi:hypothetical protein
MTIQNNSPISDHKEDEISENQKYDEDVLAWDWLFLYQADVAEIFKRTRNIGQN